MNINECIKNKTADNKLTYTVQFELFKHELIKTSISRMIYKKNITAIVCTLHTVL